mgnify:CR=1 FL=1
MDMIQTLAQELNKDPRHVENVVRLLDEGNTIPLSLIHISEPTRPY